MENLSYKSCKRKNNKITLNHKKLRHSFGDIGQYYQICGSAILYNFQEKIEVSHKLQFDPKGSGKELWEDLKSDGQLDSDSGKYVIKAPIIGYSTV